MGFFCSHFLCLFMMMNCLSWNIRRAVNAARKRMVKELIEKYHPNIFLIMEPHY